MSSSTPQAAAGVRARSHALGTGVMRAGVQSALAGAAAALLEGGRAIALGAGVNAAAIVAGCAAAAAIAVALAVVAVVAVAAALPWPEKWRRLWRETPRRLLGWRAALAVGGIAVLGAVTYRVAAWAHVVFRFNEPGPVALLLAAVVAAAAVGIGGLALLADAAVTGWLERRAASAAGASRPGAAGGAEKGGAASARRRWAGIIGGVGLLALLPVAVVRWTVPALNLAPVATFSVLLAGVGALRVLRMGDGRAGRVAAVVVVLGSAAGLWASTGSPAARGAATSTGVLSRLALRQLWALGDGDGDGYARASFGGADCDDGDRRRSPRAAEVAGNGVDENCSGADGEVAALRHRVQAPAAGGAATLTAAAAGGPPRPNILVISLDALRADHLGAWGYRRPTSPNLDLLAARSARFSWAMTSCPSTRCAVPALLTGRYATTLRDGAQVPTLAGVLAAAGWETATITCCDRFTASSADLAGFALVDTSADALRQRRPGQSNADAVVEKALRWLERRKAASAAAALAESAATNAGTAAAAAAPFFLWMHLFDPHSPYQAPYQPRRFGDRDVDRYDAEIQFADEQMGRLFAELHRLGLEASTIVVVTADHGDEFGEHGIRFHARSLFNQVVRIPLLVYLPPAFGGAATGHVDATPVSLVDVMPTVLELAGAPLPTGMNGRSLAAAVRGEKAAPARPVLIELVPDHQIARDMAAIVWGEQKAIWDREANAWSLYSLAADPFDERDLVEDIGAERRTTLAELSRLLRAALDAELGQLPPR